MSDIMESINAEFFALVESGDAPSAAYKKMVHKNSYRIFAQATYDWNEPPMSADVSTMKVKFQFYYYYYGLNNSFS